ncbi:hypothetical protein DM684_13635 [Salmonella bongori]|nr:hypothetical protein [Salmonella bongori]ECE6548130.1 hypothetical protein [Salmonella bongori]ECI3519094.1 hypothetical protein [Salmonella bongori]
MKLVNCTSTSGKGKTGYNLSVLMINQPAVRLLIYFDSGRKKARSNDTFEPDGDAKHLMRPGNAEW